jgi:hypothetical protein
VHDAIWPAQAPVCPTLTCRAVLGRAFFTIKRWLDQQDNSPSTSTDSTVSKSTSTARFHSESTTLFPHGLGIGYSNDNLTDSAARYILKNDPEAAQFFKVLPPNLENGETDEHPATEPATSAAEGIDYAKLAAAVVDEQERRQAAGGTKLSASTGGAAGKSDADDDEKPLPISRQNKEQLVATYREELGTEPSADLLNDDLRAAITAHRAGKQDPE